MIMKILSSLIRNSNNRQKLVYMDGRDEFLPFSLPGVTRGAALLTTAPEAGWSVSEMCPSEMRGNNTVPVFKEL